MRPLGRGKEKTTTQWGQLLENNDPSIPTNNQEKIICPGVEGGIFEIEVNSNKKVRLTIEIVVIPRL